MATRLFELPRFPEYGVSADGQRFVMVETLETGEEKPLSIRVVQNWYEEFRDREQESVP